MTAQKEAMPRRLNRLTGDEGGNWRVVTATSEYFFDLDAMTVTRHPGVSAAETINDVARPIHTIGRCEVGHPGFWTMKPEGSALAFLEGFWQQSTQIQIIEEFLPTAGLIDGNE